MDIPPYFIQIVSAVTKSDIPIIAFGRRYETMTNIMDYNGYYARIEYHHDLAVFTGKIAGLRKRVSFQSDSVQGLRSAFHDALEDYFKTYAKSGKDPHKPYSGQIMVRISPEVHRKAVIAAHLAGQSLTQWAEEVFDQAAGLTAHSLR